MNLPDNTTQIPPPSSRRTRGVQVVRPALSYPSALRRQRVEHLSDLTLVAGNHLGAVQQQILQDNRTEVAKHMRIPTYQGPQMTLRPVEDIMYKYLHYFTRTLTSGAPRPSLPPHVVTLGRETSEGTDCQHPPEATPSGTGLL